MQLPEELLQDIAECIAYDTVFAERQMPKLRWKYSTTELLCLSIANHQLRRICFPFLFSCVEVELNDLKKLTDLCADNEKFALSIRALNLENTSRELRDETTDGIGCLLNHLKHLLQLNLTSIWLDNPLLTVINSHPVPSVIVSDINFCDAELLSKLGPGQLAKFLFNVAAFYDENGRNELEAYSPSGAQVRQLNISRADRLQDSIRTWTLHGLCELRLNLERRPTSLSWIPEFACANPLLQKICFTASFSSMVNVLHDPTIPFIKSFVEEAYEAGLNHDLTIKGFAITRHRGSTVLALGDLREWYVSGLHLIIPEWSSGRLLHIAHSLFPQISVLTIGNLSAPFDELVTALGRFSSLQIVNFDRPPRFLLGFGKQSPDHAEMEAAMMQYTSCIAQRIPSIEAFYILALEDKESWLQGWLNVQTFRTRHTIGPLHRHIFRSREKTYPRQSSKYYNFVLLV